MRKSTSICERKAAPSHATMSGSQPSHWSTGCTLSHWTCTFGRFPYCSFNRDGGGGKHRLFLRFRGTHAQDRQEGFLRDFHASYAFHPLLAFLLLFEQLALA